MASSPAESKFNIISFAGKVVKWCSKLVKCSLSTVTEAAAWIRALQCGDGAEVVCALAAAFEDPGCQAVYLVTDAVLESASEEICHFLIETGESRPVHIVYLVGNPGDFESHTQKIMEKVARQSGGSFRVISFHTASASDEVNTKCSNVHCCSAVTNPSGCSLLLGCPKKHFPTCGWRPDPPTLPLASSAKENLMDLSLEVPHLLRGARILARRETDGYYYQGHIAQQVKRSGEWFLIEFERSRLRKGKVQHRMQETPLYDIIQYEDARRLPLAPGDRVLAPWEPKGERYGPGTVLQVAESKAAHLVPDNREVLVNFWNGRTKKVRADQALWIPLPLSERIILELQMPLAARQMLVESSSDYPYVVTPGYRASGHCRHLDPVHCQSDSQVQSYPDCCFLCPSLCHCCPVAWVPIRPRVSRVHSDDDLIPGTSLTKEELSRKIEEQLSKGSTLISEWVSREEEKEEKKGAKEGSAPKDLKSWMEVGSKVTEAKKNPQELNHARVDMAVNTDSCLMELMYKDREGKRYHEADPEAHFKNDPGLLQSRIAEAPAQQPQTNPSNKVHAFSTSGRQAWFHRVDQSLKKDRLTIESTMCAQRPHSAPTVQKSAITNATEESLREANFNAARIEHKRQQEKQRQVKREQQQLAEGLRHQLLQDNRRQRSLQRMLQGLEKQLEHNEQACQHMVQLQAARAERNRKESSLQEEEKKKETQRLQFLKAQRLQREKILAEYDDRISDQDKKRQDLLRTRRQSRQEILKQEVQEQHTQQRKHEAAVQVWGSFLPRDLQRKECLHVQHV
ncbi:trichohyalin-like [Alligator mississippiensis]|uniref:Trichohyalin-like n=1 Tax=Alligator mississippiensis TaxID=8496 RepID=A0A151NI80_ALLMI|nr:trichohyalin-like [Alligator mississippiensis]